LTAWNEHGGRIDAARRAYADAPSPWLDLSTGINPSAWAGIDLNALDLGALPSPSDLAALEEAARQAFGSATLGLAAVPGTEIGLRSLGGLGLPAPYRHVAPTYRTHEAMFPESRAIAIGDLETEAERGGTIVLANPNNPDGRMLSPARLLTIARALRNQGGWLIVDEAFADATPHASMLPMLGEEDTVIVCRSFGKFFGLAGVRLGFVSAPSPQLAMLRRQFGSWPVSTPAIAIGTAAYRDLGWITAARATLVTQAEHLDALLARHGLSASGECPLFRLIETADAAAIFERLARAGILIRPFDYAPHWLRFGLPADAAALDRLDRALGHG
jgi:cobalamin biosynthesis protein CobC